MQFQIHHGRIDLENVRCTIQPQEIRDRSHEGQKHAGGVKPFVRLWHFCETDFSLLKIMIQCFAKNYHIKVTKICNLLPDNGTSVRRIVVCWASVQNFKAERIEQVGSLEIRVNLKTERNDIYFQDRKHHVFY